MVLFRVLVVATIAAVLMAAGGAAAFADPPSWAHAAAPRSHEVVTGTILEISYATTSILVSTPHGVVAVAVTPTTSIFSGGGFASFSDLGRGAHVSIDVSEIDGRLVAQIIRVH